eukprot:scaffold35971_cov65-Phaeocystis_antarctica.AAC.1
MVDLYLTTLCWYISEGVYSRSSARAQPDRPRIRLANIYTRFVVSSPNKPLRHCETLSTRTAMEAARTKSQASWVVSKEAPGPLLALYSGFSSGAANG